MSKNEWPRAFRCAHLAGGMRAQNVPGDATRPGAIVEFYPRIANTPHGFRIKRYHDFHGALSNGGFKLLGVEFMTHQDQLDGLMRKEWRVHFWGEGELAHNAKELWSQMATAGHEIDDFPFIDLCRRISFQIEAGAWRLHELSDAYFRELASRTCDGDYRHGQRFESVNSFFIYLALHSFLSEVATLRDYLAEFCATHIFLDAHTGKTQVRLMTSLRKYILPKFVGRHPLADEIHNITGDDGWLKILSAYRDLAVHYTPLSSSRHHGFLEQEILQIETLGQFPQIRFSLPRNPDEVRRIRSSGGYYKSAKEWLRDSFSAISNNESGPDALLYCHYALGKMAQLALAVGRYSRVKPKIAHIGPADINGPVVIRRRS